MIFSMAEDHSGIFWFATRNHGICHYDGKTFTSIGASEGFTSNGPRPFYTITTMVSGSLRLTTEYGILTVNPF